MVIFEFDSTHSRTEIMLDESDPSQFLVQKLSNEDYSKSKRKLNFTVKSRLTFASVKSQGYRSFGKDWLQN